MAGGALKNLRVLDLTSATAAYCGKLLADLGAEVVKVESPAGDPARNEAPFFESAVGRASIPFHYANANKRSIILDLTLVADRSQFCALTERADLILESMPVGALSRMGLGYSDLAAEHPKLIMTSISGFGQTGPQKDFRSNDLVASALGGAMVSIGHPDDPPVRMAGHQSDVMSSALAAGSSLIALYHANRTGLGQHIDISSLEVMASTTHIAGVGKWLEDGVIPRREGTGLVASVPSGAYSCRDGLVYLMVNRPAHWKALAAWIHEVTGNEEVLGPEFHGPSSNRIAFRELLDVFIGDLAGTLTVDEMVADGQRRHIAVTPVQSAARVAQDPHLHAQNFFIDLALDGERSLPAPGTPYRMSRTRRAQAATAPRLGQHNDGVFQDANTAAARANNNPDNPMAIAMKDSMKEALSGLRVVEFGTGLAAPWIGRMLAWAGAEVIKIESHAFPDVPRLFVPPREPELGTQPQCSPWFTDWSAGKRFASLDLRNEEGAEIARRIVDTSDAVIANYSSGVLEKLGLGSKMLCARNPELVMLESSGFGGSGPFARYVTWGPNIEAVSGLSSLSGFQERACTLSHFAYPDPLSASHGLVLLLAGLLGRDRVGGGQVIALSQFETTVAAIGSQVLEFAASQIEPKRLGNREVDRAPYGCFPCQGDDRWCVICIEDEADWQRLCQLIQGESSSVLTWMTEPRFHSMSARVEHADELESRIAEWTMEHVDYDLMEACQRVGIAAGVVQTAEDLFRHDEQLAQRDFFEEIPHFKKGVVTATGIPLGLTGTPGRTRHAGSKVGHDNDYVFREILKMSDDQIRQFVLSGAIEERR